MGEIEVVDLSVEKGKCFLFDCPKCGKTVKPIFGDKLFNIPDEGQWHEEMSICYCPECREELCNECV